MDKLKKWYADNRQEILYCGTLLGTSAALLLLALHVPESNAVRTKREREEQDKADRLAEWDRNMDIADAYYADKTVRLITPQDIVNWVEEGVS